MERGKSIKRFFLIIFVLLFYQGHFLYSWNTSGSKLSKGHLLVDGKKAGMVLSYFADLSRPSGYVYHDAAHVYLLERAIDILRRDKMDNWADMAAAYLTHLASGSRHADAYKGRIVIRLELEVLWGLITADSWEWDLTCAGGCEHYHNCKENSGLNLTEWSILADAADFLIKIITLFGPENLTLGLLNLDIEVRPDIKSQYPSGVQLCKKHYDNAVKAWNGRYQYPQRTYLESAMYELGWACHHIQDLTVAQHLHNMFIGGHADYEDFGDGKGDQSRYHAQSANQIYLHKRKNATPGWGAYQLADELAKNMFYNQPGNLKKAEDGGDNERAQALEVALKKAEQYTAALLAHFFEHVKIPRTVPPLKGWVRASNSGAVIPGAYVFFAPVGTTLQIEQNLTEGEKKAMLKWSGWDFVRTDKNGHYKIPVKRFTRYWLRPAMPGYSFRGKTSGNLEFGQKVCPVVYNQPAGVSSGGSMDFFLDPIPKMVLVKPIGGNQKMWKQGTFLQHQAAVRPDIISGNQILAKTGGKISTALSRTIHQGLLKVENSNNVLGVRHSQDGLPDESIAIIRVGKLISIPQAKVLVNTTEITNTVDSVRLQMAKIPKFSKMSIQSQNQQVKVPAGLKLLSKEKFLTLKGLLPRKTIHIPGKGQKQVIKPAAFFDGRDTAFKLMENGLIPVPAKSGVVVEISSISGTGLLSIVNPIQVTTNKDGVAAFKIESGSHAGRLRFKLKIVKNPEALQIKPSGILEILVKPTKKSMDPVTETSSKISPWIVPNIIEAYTITGGDQTQLPESFTTTLHIGPDGIREAGRPGDFIKIEKKEPHERLDPDQPDPGKDRPHENVEPKPVHPDREIPDRGKHHPVPHDGTFFTDFEGPLPEGWEFPHGSKIGRIRDGHALLFPKQGHGIWVAIQSNSFKMECRYRHGKGMGVINLCMSGEPPEDKNYGIRFFPEEIDVVKFISQRETFLGQCPLRLKNRSWHHLEVRVHHGSIRVKVDGKQLLDVSDPRALPAGAIGFGCLDGGGFAFDDIHVFMGGEPHDAVPSEEPPHEEQPSMQEIEKHRVPERETGPPERKPSFERLPHKQDERHVGIIDLNGQWSSNIGRIYHITQDGKQFIWRVEGLEEVGKGVIREKSVSASWRTGRKTGQSSGQIVYISPNGRALRIKWENGVVFHRR